jgi:phosphoglucosamine mutase
MTALFGTDGIRARADDAVLADTAVERLAAALRTFLAHHHGPDRPRLLVGRDPRASGPRIVEALRRGWGRGPGTFLDAGILPTPAIAALLLEEEADLAVSVTASHNPATDNGIKVFRAGGHKLSPAEEREIETILAAGPAGETSAPFHPEASRERLTDGAERYLAWLREREELPDLSGWRIVGDTAHGATVETTPVLLRSCGAEWIGRGDAPDGANINRDCGSEHPETLAEEVRRHGAHLGIAHDGDGDRVVFVDERGETVAGEQVLGILALERLRPGQVPEPTLVTTVQSNRGLDRALAGVGGTVERCEVGDREVARRMEETGCPLGGESSGHYILAQPPFSGDGLRSALRLLRLLVRQGQPLSALGRAIPLLPQATGKVPVLERRALEECRALAAARVSLEEELGADGRVHLRYSGTEPLLRLLVEAPLQEQADEGLQRLVAAARADLAGP